MKLVKDKKVVTLRPKYSSVQKVIKQVSDYAHELQGIIVIEIPKKNKPMRKYLVNHSNMRLDTLAWAMNVANKEVSDIINRPSTKE